MQDDSWFHEDDFHINTDSLTILEAHMTVTRKHDTQIILFLFHNARRRFKIKVLFADKIMTTRKSGTS